MPDVARAVSGIPRADPGGRVTPRFRHRLIRFRHFCSGSLALASLDLACRNLVPAFPQRSPPRLLTAAACSGLGSAPDCRTRRALLHLSYSCASPFGPATLVTHDPLRAFARTKSRRAATVLWLDLANGVSETKPPLPISIAGGLAQRPHSSAAARPVAARLARAKATYSGKRGG